MKVLVVASTLDLRYRLGCTPAWWQLLKAMHEAGHEVIAVPYLGDPVETPWWRTLPNPCSAESRLFLRASGTGIPAFTGKAGLSKKVAKALIRSRIQPAWRRFLTEALAREKDVALVLLLNVPLNHVPDVAEVVHAQGVRVAYWDGDMPTILPETALERGFRFNYYEGADLSGFDAFFSNSKGVLPRLKELGARDPRTLYYAADPQLFKPAEGIAKEADVAFYGHGSELREEWMRRMIAGPSRFGDLRIVAAGGGFKVDLARAEVRGPMPFSSMARFVAAAHVNLNITRSTHTSVEASATARPFELAAYGACVVSQPYLGFGEWFEDGREVVMLREGDDPHGVYRALLDDPERIARLGAAARRAIEQRHTWGHRVRELLGA